MSEKTAVDFIQETIDVNEKGDVSFRSDQGGRGRGRKTVIPADQFDRFADIIKRIAKNRNDLAEVQKKIDA
jgi:hypothetical protein